MHISKKNPIFAPKITPDTKHQTPDTNMSFICYIIVIEIVLFCVYVIYTICRWGIPASLSATYYYFERVRKNYGLFFPLYLSVCCLSSIPLWIYTNKAASPWVAHFSWCPYLTCLCLLCVGATCRYKMSRFTTYFHYTTAIISAVSTGIWLLIACYKLALVSLSVMSLSVLAGFFTHTLKRCYLFWLELGGFLSLFFILFLVNFNHLSI